MKLNAATMLGQSKTAQQAEIDSACELVDFFRFNCYYMQQIYSKQFGNSKAVWNRMEYRALEGFVFAVTPFNFTSIAGNLPTAPAIMGNVSLWKPASTAVLSSYYIMKTLQEAGLPDGVINFIPGKGSDIADIVLPHRELAGIHFTGSTSVFKSMWKKVAENIEARPYYPRLVGETGGKNFVLAYNDCNIDELVVGLIRGAFEYQGQKCSAVSRAYIPLSIWSTVKSRLIEEIKNIKTGDITDFSNFMGAVIDKDSFNKLRSCIEEIKQGSDAKIIAGGTYDDKKGYFIHPTIVETSNPRHRTMTEELFGPILAVYVYNDSGLEEILDLIDSTSEYALTGAVFAKNINIIRDITKRLENTAGNFYINDKPTGAVVGQQPFGGARASGTNDKAGSYLNLIRWTSARAIKENFNPPKESAYPFMK
jgi:1-pyrroline-5-carboxylate dehydrogenase